MDREEIIRMAREAGLRVGTNLSGVVLVGSPAEIGLAHLTIEELERFAALVADHERDRICKAIKEEDDYCVTEGDYMLDSDDCIAIAKGDWVRPDYSATAIRGMR
jgi:hypothetical protein